MDTKLTLKLNEEVIEKAKLYAKEKQTSLSSLVENYLQKLTADNTSKETITPLVRSLSGIINLPNDYDEKKEYSEYLSQKYK